MLEFLLPLGVERTVAIRMTCRQSTLRLIAAAMTIMAMLAVLAACGDPKAQPPAIVVTFDATYSPPPSLTPANMRASRPTLPTTLLAAAK